MAVSTCVPLKKENHGTSAFKPYAQSSKRMILHRGSNTAEVIFDNEPTMQWKP
jgi:hypothetical protein